MIGFLTVVAHAIHVICTLKASDVCVFDKPILVSAGKALFGSPLHPLVPRIRALKNLVKGL